MSTIYWLLQFFLALLLAPLLTGIINRIKAVMAGRHGKPVLQCYYDLAKLMRKSEVISPASSWPFLLGPPAVLGSSIFALALLPFGGTGSPVGFSGDFILAAYLLGMGRFAIMASALDTGSAFEGMGASREATFGALAEPALFLAFMALSSACLELGHFSTSQAGEAFTMKNMLCGKAALAWTDARPAILIIPFVLFILLLAENCRIPVDDPNTHLELTMIHEVMILDQSGPGLAMMIYGATLKLWFFCSLAASLIVPPLPFPQACILWLLAIFAMALLVGVTESIMARLRLPRVAHLLGMASALAALALILVQVS